MKYSGTPNYSWGLLSFWALFAGPPARPGWFFGSRAEPRKACRLGSRSQALWCFCTGARLSGIGLRFRPRFRNASGLQNRRCFIIYTWIRSYRTCFLACSLVTLGSLQLHQPGLCQPCRTSRSLCALASPFCVVVLYEYYSWFEWYCHFWQTLIFRMGLCISLLLKW